MKFRELKLRKDADCPVCGTHPTVTKLIDYEQFCGVAPRPESDSVNAVITDEMTARELKERLDRGEPIVDRRRARAAGVPDQSDCGLEAHPARRVAAAL